MDRLNILIVLLLFVSCSSKEVRWDATGTFESTEVIVSAEGTGSIEVLKFELGDMLTQGVMVGYIDTVQLHLKRLQLLSNRSSALVRRSDISKQIAATEQQILWQESERQRYVKLLARSAATQKQVDDIENQIAVLQRQLSAQRSTLEKTNSSITDDALALEIQIAQIEDQLRKCRICSPITGRVLVKYAQAGEFAATGRQLFTVANLDSMYLRAYITADLLTQIKLGQQVHVYSDFGVDSQREYPGEVVWISDNAEFTPKTIQTRDERANLVYAMKIMVQNDGYLKIGMYGQMKL